jgi:DNA-binding NtrC family response regulator
MSSTHLLLVDDDPALLRALKLELLGQGYVLHFAHSAAEALRMLYEFPINIVLTDHYMPDKSGVQLLCQVKEDFPYVVRGLITGEPDVSLYMRAVNDGQIHFIIHKPWVREELRATVRKAESRAVASRSGREDGAGNAEAIIALHSQHPGITQVRRTKSGAIVIDEDVS